MLVSKILNCLHISHTKIQVELSLKNFMSMKKTIQLNPSIIYVNYFYIFQENSLIYGLVCFLSDHPQETFE